MKGFKTLKIELEFPNYYTIGNPRPKIIEEDNAFIDKLVKYYQDNGYAIELNLYFGDSNTYVTISFLTLNAYINFQKHFLVQNVS